MQTVPKLLDQIINNKIKQNVTRIGLLCVDSPKCIQVGGLVVRLYKGSRVLFQPEREASGLHVTGIAFHNLLIEELSNSQVIFNFILLMGQCHPSNYKSDPSEVMALLATTYIHVHVHTGNFVFQFRIHVHVLPLHMIWSVTGAHTKSLHFSAFHPD